MTLNCKEIVAHAVKSIRHAPLSYAPFPNLVVDNIFPKEYYDRLVGLLPPRDGFGVYAPGTPRHQESYFKLLGHEYAALSPEHKDYMDVLYEAFPAISKEIARRLNPFVPAMLSQLFPDDWEERSKKTELHHSLGYYIIDRVKTLSQTAHTDSAYRVFTWLFYMPEKADYPHMGTDLFTATPENWDTYDPMYTYFRTKPEGIKLDYHSTFQYLPNRVVAFVNGPLSFHGFQALGPHENASPRRVTINSYIEFSRSSYEAIFGDVPLHYHELHNDFIWKPSPKAA